jgi:hypothetical protein
MAASRALIIAVVGMALLVVSITVDVNVNRAFYVDAKDAGEWRTVGELGAHEFERPYATPIGPYGAIVVPPNGSLDMRVRVDNGYPWAYAQHYVVLVNGAQAASGELTAPARGMGEAAFSLPASKLYATAGPDCRGASDVKIKCGYPSIVVMLGTKSVYANVQVQEAS